MLSLISKIRCRLIWNILLLRDHKILREDIGLDLEVGAHHSLVTIIEKGFFLMHCRIVVLLLKLIMELILERIGYCGIAILVMLLLHCL